MASSIFSGIGDSLAELGRKPDLYDSPAKRKAARIAYDILIIGLGLAVMAAVTGGFDLSSMADPGAAQIMTLPMVFGISAVGMTWLLKEIMPKEWYRVASKVMAFLLPALMIAGTVCMCGASFTHIVGPHSITTFALLGPVLVPLAFGTIGYSASALKNNDTHFFPRRVMKPQGDEPINLEEIESESESFEEPFISDDESHSEIPSDISLN